MNMDTNKINDLAKILRQNQLTKLDLTEGDTRIVLEAGGRNPRWWVRFILRHRQGQSPLCRWAIR